MAEHDEVRELLGAYALDAVDHDERALVEAHLPTCDECAREVDAHREVAALLAGEGEAPPRHVWERVAAAVAAVPPGRADAAGAAGERPPRAATAPARGRPARGRRDPAGGAGAAALPSSHDRRGLLRRPEVWLTGAAAAAVLVVAALVALLGDDDPSVDDLVRRSFEAALEAPGSEVADLEGTEGGVALRAVLWGEGRGFLDASDLPPLPEGRAYQLWRLDGDRAVSLGVLGPDPGVVAFQAGPDVAALAVSEEAAGGAAAPGEQIVATARF